MDYTLNYIMKLLITFLGVITVLQLRKFKYTHIAREESYRVKIK